MSFEVTAEPARFPEAVDWFSKRVVLTRSEAAKLGEEAGRRAFWVGGGLQLAQIQRVFDKLGKAVADGTPFDEWRKSVKDELRNDHHAETVFRNATQRSLNAGRWRQMREPGVLAFRPYWLFDGVEDSRQSPICRRCNGVILPADHAWWQTHTPLLHHRCRSSIRNMRRSEAQRRGITNVPPIESADDGFGLSPEREPDWKPDAKKTDPALLKELNRKRAAGRAKPKAPPKPPKEHSLEHWEKHYAPLFGESAPTVAWGRTMLERGLDRSPAELRAELKRLAAAGTPGEYGSLWFGLERFDQNRPLRGQMLTPRQRYAVMLAEHSLTIERGAGVELAGLAKERRVREASKFYEQLADKKVGRPVGWAARHTKGARAFASPSARLIELGDDGTPVAIHEIAHAIEFSDNRALQRSVAFLKARAGKEKLSSLVGHGGATDAEQGWLDDFVKGYIGKDYGGKATELTSMGYQAMGGGQRLAQGPAGPRPGHAILPARTAGRTMSLFELPDFGPTPLDGLVELAATAVRAAEREAVAKWAEQMGVTPERWLEVYAVEVQQRIECTKLHLTVNAVLRGDDAPKLMRAEILRA
jgi:SPP1 gp7 family putative phage head morphogenesis protein